MTEDTNSSGMGVVQFALPDPGPAPGGGAFRQGSGADVYRTLLLALPDAYLSIDGDGRVVEWSPRAVELFGWSARQVTGQDARQLQLPDAYCADRRLGLPVFVRPRRPGGRRGFEQYLAVDANGEEFPVELSMVKAPEGPALPQYLCLVKDIRHRVIAEERLAQAAKMDAIAQLASGLAHDFNNVLGIVIGSLDALGSRVSDPVDVELVKLAQLATDRGTEVTRSMQAVARRQPVKPEKVDINRAIHGLEPLLKQSLGKRIDLSVVAEAALARVVIDAGSFSNVMLNFVINARDAMPAGGLVLIYTQNVEIVSADSLDALDMAPGHYVVVGIDDTGQGMPPEVLARATEPFFTTKERGKGTGLGLAMAYAFARQSSGALRLRSTPGKGTNIHLFIPCLPDAAGEIHGASSV